MPIMPFMLSVTFKLFMLNVVMPSVIMLNVVAPPNGAVDGRNSADQNICIKFHLHLLKILHCIYGKNISNSNSGLTFLGSLGTLPPNRIIDI
jgi:hypothetical protein